MALTRIVTNAITDDAITTAKIAPNTVIAADILDGSLTNDKLADGTIQNAKLAGSIANDKLANSSVTINGSSVALGASVEISAGTAWQTGIVADGSTVTTSVAGNGYFIDTTSFAHTINLPSTPSLGDEVSIIDASGTADTNNITVGRNGENIQGLASDLTISTERAAFTLVYFNATQGWLLKDK